MKIRYQGLILLLGLFAASGRADLVNGSVSSPAISDASSMNVSSDLDQGWHAWSASLYDLSENDIWSTWLINQPGCWFGQIFTDNHATYGDVMLKFDVTYMGANIRSAMFQYALYGTDSTDASTTAFALNTDSNPAGPAWTPVSSGAVSTPDEGLYQAKMTSSGTAYQYLAVRFRFTGMTSGRGTDYATAVDNISVASNHSVIPEPAAVTLIGLGGIVTLFANRLGRRNR
ncbi:MAG TPA: hypothetical protein PKI68_04625 [Pontiellaceae bacterium]|nr:hypothetical protein [Pontiellaceae bacterium]